MDVKSYLRRSSSGAEIVASIAFYAGAEALQRAATSLKRAAAGIGALVNAGSRAAGINALVNAGSRPSGIGALVNAGSSVGEVAVTPTLRRS